jgi:hypothetical protein
MVANGSRDFLAPIKNGKLLIELDVRLLSGTKVSPLTGCVQLLLDTGQQRCRLVCLQLLVFQPANRLAQLIVISLHDLAKPSLKVFDLLTSWVEHFS